jgi:hypothetical protein
MQLSILYQTLFGVLPNEEKLHDALYDVVICIRCFYMMRYNIDIIDYNRKIKELIWCYYIKICITSKICYYVQLNELDVAFLRLRDFEDLRQNRLLLPLVYLHPLVEWQLELDNPTQWLPRLAFRPFLLVAPLGRPRGIIYIHNIIIILKYNIFHINFK